MIAFLINSTNLWFSKSNTQTNHAEGDGHRNYLAILTASGEIALDNLLDGVE